MSTTSNFNTVRVLSKSEFKNNFSSTSNDTLYFVEMDNTMFDGQWVSKKATLSTATAVGTYTIDLSSYLPNDTYNYEVILEIRFRNTNSNDALLNIETSLVEKLTIARANAEAEKGGYSQIIPVGYDKKAILNIVNRSFNKNTITAIAYRRIGTNQ